MGVCGLESRGPCDLVLGQCLHSLVAEPISRDVGLRRDPLWLTVLSGARCHVGAFRCRVWDCNIVERIRWWRDRTRRRSALAQTVNLENCTVVKVTPAEFLPRASQVTVNVYNSTKSSRISRRYRETIRCSRIQNWLRWRMTHSEFPLKVSVRSDMDQRVKSGAKLIAYPLTGRHSCRRWLAKVKELMSPLGVSSWN